MLMIWTNLRRHGSYLVVGLDYGGEIMFTSTSTVRNKEDKKAVTGGLSYVSLLTLTADMIKTRTLNLHFFENQVITK